jgi:hypothetical protein
MSQRVYLPPSVVILVCICGLSSLGCGAARDSTASINLELLRTAVDSTFRYINDSTLASGFQLGELPIRVLFSGATFSEQTRLLKISGQVVLRESEEPIPSTLVAIGTLSPSGERRFFVARHKTRSDSSGTFSLQGQLEPGDRLVFLKWPFLVPIYRVGELIK